MLRPLKCGKRYNSYTILPEPQRNVVFLPNGWTGEDLKKYLEHQVFLKANQKIIERQLKIEKIKSRLK